MAQADPGSVRRGRALIAAPALYALLLLAGPLGTIVLFSFWSQDFLALDRSPTLGNYAEALREPLYRELMLRSLAIAMAVTVTTVLLAFPVAYFVSFKVAPARKALWLFLITIPFWTSYLVRVFLWKVILGFNGVVNASLLGAGIIDAPLTFILYNPVSVVITLTHAFAPFAILPIYVALERIDHSLIEASRDLGESRASTFRRVTLPLALPGVMAAALIVFIPVIGDYVTPRLVGGPSGLMIANMIQTQFLKLNNAPLGAALAVLAMLIVTAIALVAGLALRRFSGPRG
ncbi:ABC transporter permease [Profundibacterium mesophilum]|uniref:ABC spermidineputrescine transporter inner membrane subunit n=1 Tax=Profundibacterium mesophilum KAUST100406-0324 TaxID=1037889 RepID=A0A921NU46_9RHOB|nr:ABC transporter permease [Profundibacterium mesophilum]KAF0675236.1 ABC spermidineputrescine transporter inner membrane subunit [Profundibacterium mesophilum KAUST100406-0324]